MNNPLQSTMKLTNKIRPNLRAAFIPIYCLSSFFSILPVTLHFGWRDCISPRAHIPMMSGPFRAIFATIVLILTILHGISAPIYVVQTSMPESFPKSIFVRKSLFANESTIDPNSDTKQSLIMKILYPVLVAMTGISVRTLAICSLRKGLKDFFAKIDSADQFLGHIKNFEKAVNTKAHLQYSVALCCYFLIAGLPIQGNYLLSAILLNNRYGVAWCFALAWSTMTGFCGDILFSYCAYLIRVRFKVVNAALCSIRTDDNCFYTELKLATGYEGIIK